MATQGDYRARFAAGMLNEDFQAALDRIIKKKTINLFVYPITSRKVSA